MIRHLLGLIGLVLLRFGIGYEFSSDVSIEPMYSGMLIRVGALLGVIWLAYPELQKSKAKIPGIILGLIVLFLVLAAARPKISNVILVIGVLTIAVSTGLRFLKGLGSAQ